jgi:hypothetical protein
MQIDIKEDHIPSDKEYNNLCYLTCKYTVQWPMRLADLYMCKMAAQVEDLKGAPAIEHFVRVTCGYLWDHICGEPGDVDPDNLYEHIKPIIEEWYKVTTPEERECIE